MLAFLQTTTSFDLQKEPTNSFLLFSFLTTSQDYYINTFTSTLILFFAMLQIKQDPTNIACPDFAGATYATIRQIMTNNRQVDNNHAVGQLTAAWNLTHEQEVEAWCQ